MYANECYHQLLRDHFLLRVLIFDRQEQTRITNRNMSVIN